MKIWGRNVQHAYARLCEILDSGIKMGSDVCVCIEGGRDTGKTMCIEAIAQEKSCDIFRWDDVSVNTNSMHDSSTKTMLSLLQKDASAISNSNKAQGPVLLIADNVHDIFQENRMAVQLLLRKACTISGKRGDMKPTKSRKSHIDPKCYENVNRRRKKRSDERPIFFIITYDPEKLESRVLSQVRRASSYLPLAMDHPNRDELIELVIETVKSEIKQDESGSYDKNKTIIDVVEEVKGRLSLIEKHNRCSVLSVLSVVKKALRMKMRSVRGQGETVDEEDGERDIDDTDWDKKFRYTGFKIDSMANYLRQSSIPLIGGAAQLLNIADGLILANVLAGGVRNETFDHGMRDLACALTEVASSCCHQNTEI